MSSFSSFKTLPLPVEITTPIIRKMKRNNEKYVLCIVILIHVLLWDNHFSGTLCFLANAENEPLFSEELMVFILRNTFHEFWYKFQLKIIHIKFLVWENVYYLLSFFNFRNYFYKHSMFSTYIKKEFNQ